MRVLFGAMVASAAAFSPIATRATARSSIRRATLAPPPAVHRSTESFPATSVERLQAQARTNRAAAAVMMGVTISWYDKLLNKAAPIVVPLLVSMGKVFQPLYKLWDKYFPTPSVRSLSNSYKPVVVFSSRTVKNVAAYKKEFAAYAEATQSRGSGVRACFSFMESGKEDTALQFAWYDSAADFVAQPPQVTACYAGTEASDYLKVWGEWSDDMKAALSLPGVKCSFVKENRGFLKSPSAETKAGFATGEPPMSA
jgi:hypothetical protein